MRRTRLICALFGIICVSLGLTGCGGGSRHAQTQDAVTVTIDQSSPVQVTASGTQQFTATVTGTLFTAVTWSVQEGVPGGSFSQTTAGLYTAPAAAGTYHVIATSMADSQISNTVTVNVTASGVNTAPTASFTVNPASGPPSTSFAVDASGSTDAQDPVSALEVRWDWENDGTWDTAYSTTKTANHTYSSAGSYTIKLEVKDTGGLLGTTTHAVTVTAVGVNTAPTASFTVNPASGPPSTSFAVDASGSTDVQDPGSALQVRWDWENDGTWDTAYSTTKTANHTYSSAGSYTIKLEVKDTGGLLGSATRTVTVTGSGATLTLTLDGTVDTSSGSVKASSFTSAELLNTSGLSVKTGMVSGSSAQFDEAGLAAGTYFVRVNNLSDMLVPVRIDNPSANMTAFVGTRLMDVFIGSKTNPTYQIRTFPSGQTFPTVAKYSNGTTATPTRYSYAILTMASERIEIRTLGTAASLTSYTAGGEHSFASWIVGPNNHGIRYGGNDGRCAGCHESLDTHPASYGSVNDSNGWCYKCHYGKVGTSAGVVDPAQ